MYSYSAVKNLPIFVEIPLFQTDTRIQDIQHILDITDDVSLCTQSECGKIRTRKINTQC